MLGKEEPTKQNFDILPMFSTSWGMLRRAWNKALKCVVTLSL